MFAMAFFMGSISYMLLAFGFDETESNLILKNIYVWSFIPLLVALLIASNESIINSENFEKNFLLFLFSLIMTITLIFVPLDLGMVSIFIGVGLTIDILIITSILLFKKRELTNLMFILSMICLSFAGMQMRGGNTKLAIFSSLTGFTFLTLVFFVSSKSIMKTDSGIESYFSLKEKLIGTENALRNSREKLQTILDNVPNTIMIVDKNGSITYVNHNESGFSTESFIGTKISHYTPPEYHEIENKALEDAFNNGKPGSYIKKWVDPHKKEVLYETNIGPIKHDGIINSVVLISTDITDRIKAEKEIKEKVEILEKNEKATLNIMEDLTESLSLRKMVEDALRLSEQKLRSILESSPDSIAVIDLNGNMIECNQATLDLYGFSSKDEVIGKNALKFFSEKDKERAQKNLQKTLSFGSLKNIEYTLLANDGYEFPAELSASVILDSTGNPTSLIAITKDIGDRKSAEELLKEKTEKLERFAKLSIGREKKMVELKQRIKELEESGNR